MVISDRRHMRRKLDTDLFDISAVTARRDILPILHVHPIDSDCGIRLDRDN